jgi:hypothetical protein
MGQDDQKSMPTVYMNAISDPPDKHLTGAYSAAFKWRVLLTADTMTFLSTSRFRSLDEALTAGRSFIKKVAAHTKEMLAGHEAKVEATVLDEVRLFASELKNTIAQPLLRERLDELIRRADDAWRSAGCPDVTSSEAFKPPYTIVGDGAIEKMRAIRYLAEQLDQELGNLRATFPVHVQR